MNSIYKTLILFGIAGLAIARICLIKTKIAVMIHKLILAIVQRALGMIPIR
jgi:hypothetical protein